MVWLDWVEEDDVVRATFREIRRDFTFSMWDYQYPLAIGTLPDSLSEISLGESSVKSLSSNSVMVLMADDATPDSFFMTSPRIQPITLMVRGAKECLNTRDDGSTGLHQQYALCKDLRSEQDRGGRCGPHVLLLMKIRDVFVIHATLSRPVIGSVSPV